MSNNNVQDDLRAAILNNVQISSSSHSPRSASEQGRRRGRPRGPGRGNLLQDHITNASYSSTSGRGFAATQGSTFPDDQVNPVSRAPIRGRQQPPRRGGNSGNVQRTGLSLAHTPQILQRPPGYQASHTFPSPNIQSGPHSKQPYPPRSTKPSTFRPLQGPPSMESFVTQCNYLEHVAREQIPLTLMSTDEIHQKQNFIATLARISEDVSSADDADNRPQATLKAFGSFVSGFATKDSDVDLAIVSTTDGGALPDISLQLHEDDFPRRLEKALLECGIGARLLTRTRVPIIKVCEKPPQELLAALRAERERWDALPNEEKYRRPNEAEQDPVSAAEGRDMPMIHENVDFQLTQAVNDLDLRQSTPSDRDVAPSNPPMGNTVHSSRINNPPRQPEKRPWLREKKLGPLDFPKTGVGVISDINFSNPLVLHNTELLRCYSICDDRVRLMALFIKAWVGRRKINSSYSGTSSSYGYVLMVLHFLVNVAKPSVVPNLQIAWYLQSDEKKAIVPHNQIWHQHYDIRFFRDINEIKELSSQGRMTQNSDPLPVLLRNFFHYFAHQGPDVPQGGFSWRNEVLSIRTAGGLLTKEEKGWTHATTEIVNEREVRQRYLFAIEDPFEIEHNVARVVTHPGLVTIRDEFRRAWNILQSVGRGETNHPGLFDEILEPEWKDK